MREGHLCNCEGVMSEEGHLSPALTVPYTNGCMFLFGGLWNGIETEWNGMETEWNGMETRWNRNCVEWNGDCME